jgi:two-component system, NarL family, sensor kinase
MDSSRIQLYLVIAVAIVAMMLMAGAIILFVVFYQKKMISEQLKRQALEFDYQQRMMRAELQSQESERRRLAEDLHDSIGGMLSTIRVGMFSLAKLLPDPRSMEETKQMLDDTITSVRRISRDLMPSTLEKFGLIQAVKELCERFQPTSRIAIEFHEVNSIPEIDSQRQLMIYRIIQELLNNSIKHANASQINVTLNTIDKDIELIVDDNGVGFDAEFQQSDASSGKGLGLFNMQNRAKILGGQLKFLKNGNKGSKTVLITPITHEKRT